jgi:hypothetical protein
MRESHKDFFWLYGVIVGLAIREALTQTLHHAFSIPAPDALWMLHIESWRTLLFMVMIVRFYVGAVVFFHKVHGPSSPAAGNYNLDFVMGLIQFIFFYAWSVSIFSYSRSSKGLSAFLWGMFLILLFDLVWLLFNWRYDTAEILKVSAIVNLLTVLVSFMLFLTCADLFDMNFQIAEETALLPVFLTSILGIVESVSDTPIFTKLLQATIPKPIKTVTAPAPANTVEPAGPATEVEHNGSL